MERAKTSLKGIVGLGNDANHEIETIPEDAADTALESVEYLLNLLYAHPILENGGRPA
jgi:hypothetical protein